MASMINKKIRKNTELRNANSANALDVFATKVSFIDSRLNNAFK